ncbi:hypothetical protein [Streptomyces sp. NPDC056160]
MILTKGLARACLLVQAQGLPGGTRAADAAARPHTWLVCGRAVC